MISTRLSRTDLARPAGRRRSVHRVLPALGRASSKQARRNHTGKQQQRSRSSAVKLSTSPATASSSRWRMARFGISTTLPESVTLTVDGQTAQRPSAQAGHEARKANHYHNHTESGHHGRDGDGQGVACYSSQHRHPDARKRPEPAVQDPEGSKVHGRRRRNGRLRSQERDEGAAQRVTEVPETVVAHEIKRTGSRAAAAARRQRSRCADSHRCGSASSLRSKPQQAAPQKSEAAPKKLPTTASELPLIGLLGALFCGLSLTAMTIRMIASRFAR